MAPHLLARLARTWGRRDRNYRRWALGFAAVLAVFLGHNYLLTDVQYRQIQNHRKTDYLEGSTTVRSGEAIALLQIPSLDMNLVVAEGDTAATLRGGPAHISSTPLPGEGGNAVITGRSSRYGAPFRSLHKLKEGDEIVAQVKGGPPIGYAVTETRVTGTSEFTQDFDADRLTLVTAAGPLGRKHHVVVAERDDGGAANPPTSRSVGSSKFENRNAGVAAVALLVRLGALSAVVVMGLRIRARLRPATAALTLTPLVGYALIQLLPLEPILSNLW